jgi:signal peptidase I
VASATKQSAAGSLVELVSIVAVALGLALGIQAFLVKPFRIPSESMVPTLNVGQRVLVDRVSTRFGEPDRGDVMVFKPPTGADDDVCGVEPPPRGGACPRPTKERSDTNFIKRVVAIEGDRLSIRRGGVILNGKPQSEPFTRPDAGCGICNLPRTITIPKDHVFMMGDNRGESDDSRQWGPVPEDWMIGKAFVTYWPPNRVGGL